MTTTQQDDSTFAPPAESGLRYPEGLFEWAGHRAGGVRRLFYDAFGRPSGQLIDTPLLGRLRDWSRSIAAGRPGTPTVVLLLGGPGNGKTEAVEAAIRELELSLALDGELVGILAPRFNPVDGSTVPRSVRVDVQSLGSARQIVLTLVQDASVRDPSKPGQTAAELLVEDLEQLSTAEAGDVYLACINRGVLDDALISARESQRADVHRLLESIVRAVGAGVAAPSCWPLEALSHVAIWPMDVESLLASPETDDESLSPAAQALRLAVNPSRWPARGTCPAGDRCPFCLSREVLSGEPHSNALLQVLRYYELATGKRWTFRDLFSLLSYILAGSPHNAGAKAESPCQWAAHQLELDQRASARVTSAHYTALYQLVASQYQHALFGGWPRIRRGGIRQLLKDLQLQDDPTLLGLHYFLSAGQQRSVPRTLEAELASLNAALDPALANPDQEVEVSGKTRLSLRELDSRFSHSVREGYEAVRKYHCLSGNELELLRRLASADDRVGLSDVRRRKPTAATRLQVLIRDFACRLVRRSICCRTAVVRDVAALDEFSRLIGGDANLMYQTAKQVESLLNEHDRFVVTLNNTFGEPAPPEARRVVLETQKQKVRPAPHRNVVRPAADLRFLTIGSNTATQAIPLTYQLFRAVRDLQEGMFAGSLPRPVSAALDTVRGRLAGRIVRDEEQLDGAEIRIGIRGDRIAREMGQFIVRSGVE